MGITMTVFTIGAPLGGGWNARPVMRSISRSIRVMGYGLTIDLDPSPQPSPTRGEGAHRPSNLLNGINLICPVQSCLKKYFCSGLTQITSISLAVSSPRGAYRDRHGRGAGCGGRGSAKRVT
jgi:hypothetical protein